MTSCFFTFKLCCFFTILAGSMIVYDTYAHSESGFAPNPLDFIENKGQWTGEIKYKAEIPDGALFITDKGFVYNYVSHDDLDRMHGHSSGTHRKENADLSEKMIRFHAYKVNFEGANPDPGYIPLEKRESYHNYFTGNDPSMWAGYVGLYGKILQRNVYNGIDVAIYSRGHAVKYDFIIAPGADPGRIVLSFDGVSPEITSDGFLRIRTSVNEVMEKPPYCYQQIDGMEVPVPGRYRLEDGRLSFDLPEGYDTAYPLVVDPEMVYITWTGATGAGHSYAYSSAYDSEGNMYAGARVTSINWPVTTGAYQIASGGDHDIAVNKYNRQGNGLIYSTYYGGAGWEAPHVLYVNARGELTIGGSTTSPDLPVTPGCYDNTGNGGIDLFVARFNASGAVLTGATYIGGNSAEPRLLGIGMNFGDVNATGYSNERDMTPPVELTTDAADNVWVVSNTNSTNFPVTSNAVQPVYGGGDLDGVVFKLSPDCSQLLYSSYLGGSNTDIASTIRFNPDSNLVISGSTTSKDFPTTPGTLMPTPPTSVGCTNPSGICIDGFVTIISQSGTILHATYIGTPRLDMAEKLQVDCEGNVYILGRTSGNYPISPGVYRTVNDGGIYIDKLSSDLSTSLLSTRMGSETLGNPAAFPSAFMVDPCGYVYLSYFAINYRTSDFPAGHPITADAFYKTHSAFWMGRLTPGFQSLDYGSFFGNLSSLDHIHQGVNRFDPEGIIYHVFCPNPAGQATIPHTDPFSWAPVRRNTPSGNPHDMVSFKLSFEDNNQPLKVALTAPGGANDSLPHAVRGCKPAYIHISRDSAGTDPVTVKYLISGTAVNGVDYRQIADSIVIPSGQLTGVIEIAPELVSAPSGVKEVVISVVSPCSCGDILDEIRVLIHDSLYVRMMTSPDTVCPNTVAPVTAEIDTTLDYVWSPPEQIPDPLPLGLTIHPAPSATQIYTITVSQPGAPATCPPRSTGCEMFVEPFPELSVSPQGDTICEQHSLPVKVTVSPPGVAYQYRWSPAAYFIEDTTAADNIFHAPAGAYILYVTVTTPIAACSVTDSIMIHVVPGFRFASVSPADTTITYGDGIRINPAGDPPYEWQWSPVAWLDDPQSFTPYAAPLEDIVYTLVGADPYGCRDTIYTDIRVRYDPVMNIPNAFSPNGDGRNDVFRVTGLKFETLKEFRVFNRFGQLMYYGTDPKDGWDGMYQSGEAPVGVYYYSITLMLPDNTEAFFKGDVTLIR